MREIPPRKPKDHKFEIHTYARVYELRARSHAELTSWLNLLRQKTTLALENEVRGTEYCTVLLVLISISCAKLGERVLTVIVVLGRANG